ncbi:MAG: NAD(P)/FAD-dependent oxidoreductase [Burkholderiales bacterium]|nr:NAD(P)/FAD-dependent oxidoreductase [Burkholderiales bacterium]
MPTTNEIFDCAIIGGGPAGLTAAIYLLRYRRRVCLIDAGGSRASLIPVSHNYPGFPDGVNGNELLHRLRAQACRYGADIIYAVVEGIERQQHGIFVLHYAGRTIASRTVLLATGALDVEPALPDVPNAIAQGFLRHCPICDGYEVIGQQVGVIGDDTHGVNEALFLQTYTDRISLLTLGVSRLTAEDRHCLSAADVTLIEEAVVAVEMVGKIITGMRLADGRTLCFDSLYSALGSRVRSDLALQLGAACDDMQDLVVNKSMQTSIDGLYAAGDVVHGLSQICVATGHAAIAATSIHQRLRKFSG